MRKRVPIIANGIFLLAVFVLLLSMNLARGLNHDENQFVASGELLASRGMLPYRDYPYFHVPYLTFVYAELFERTDAILLAARLFSVICSFVALGIVFSIALGQLRREPYRVRFPVAAGSVVLLMANSLFTYTSGRAWNHDLPVLFALLAFAAHTSGIRRERSRPWLFLSGILAGLAAGTRLSFAPMLLAFPAMTLWFERGSRKRSPSSSLFAFGLGAVLALLPLAAFLISVPRQFLFGNLGYAGLNTLYRQETGYYRPLTLSGKLAYLVSDVVLADAGTALLFLAFVALALMVTIRARSDRAWASVELNFILVLLPFLLLGALAPTPPFRQYFYMLIPFLVLGLVYGLARFLERRRDRGPALGAFGLVALVAALWGAGEYREIASFLTPSEWFPVKVHEDGLEIAEVVRDGKVLTLAPIYPLEGGVQIYEEFATGPFAWRVSSLVPKPARGELKIVAESDLDEFLRAEPPKAILVGVDDDEDEGPLVAYAARHDYSPLRLSNKTTLWLAPLADWGGAIRLLASRLPPRPLEPGGRLGMVFYLQNLAPLDRDFNILVRLTGADGREVLREEGWPWGSPTSSWKLHEIWPDGHDLAIPPDTPPGYYRLELSFYDPETLERLPATEPLTGRSLGDAAIVDYLAIGRMPAEPTRPLQPPPRLGRRITLLGADLRGEDRQLLASGDPTLAPGGTLHLRLFWRAEARVDQEYTVFAHLIGPDGRLVAQDDQQPLGGFLPTTRWKVGQVVVDDYELPVAAGSPRGTYEIRVGMYDLASGQRLPVERGGHPSGDSVPIGTIRVQ